MCTFDQRGNFNPRTSGKFLQARIGEANVPTVDLQIPKNLREGAE